MHHTNTRGAIAEEQVMIWCMAQGYYPFRAVMPVGPIDIIAINEDGDTLLLDVKSVSMRVNAAAGRNKPEPISRTRSPLQKSLGVRIAYCNLETGEVRLAKHKN